MTAIVGAMLIMVGIKAARNIPRQAGWEGPIGIVGKSNLKDAIKPVSFGFGLSSLLMTRYFSDLMSIDPGRSI